MKIEIEPEDIEEIARKMAEYLKPLLIDSARGDPANNNDDELLSVDEAAALLKTSRAQIYQWVNNAQHGLGDFPYMKAGRLLRFSKAALLEWLRKSSKSLENR